MVAPVRIRAVASFAMTRSSAESLSGQVDERSPLQDVLSAAAIHQPHSLPAVSVPAAAPGAEGEA